MRGGLRKVLVERWGEAILGGVQSGGEGGDDQCSGEKKKLKPLKREKGTGETKS